VSVHTPQSQRRTRGTSEEPTAEERRGEEIDKGEREREREGGTDRESGREKEREKSDTRACT